MKYDDNSGKTFLNILQEHFEKGSDAGHSMILDAIIGARQALTYNPGISEDDIGLPAPLLVKLNWRIWHTICAWIVNNGAVDDESRKEIIKFALYDHFYLKAESDIIIREPFQIAHREKGKFPGKQIYDYFKSQIERGVIEPKIKILNPDEFVKTFHTDTNEPMYSIYNNSDFVLWIQREFINKWWPEYDPSRFNNKRDDLPYDVDHIVPAAFFDMRGVKEKVPKRFWDHRYNILNRFGNYRFWPKELNRADQDKGLKKKFLVGNSSDKLPDDNHNYRPDIGLSTVSDIKNASFVNTNKLWEKIPDSKNEWVMKKDGNELFNNEGFDAFDKVTLERIKEIYTSMYYACHQARKNT